MKKVFRILGILLLLVVLMAVGGVLYLKYAFPNVGKAPELKISATPEQIERGRYLATSVAVCIDCHSTRDWSQFSGPLVPGTEGIGSEKFGHEFGFPGDFYSRNINPAGLKGWTDGEVFRAVTTGVDKKGEPLFPIMPYHYYGQADSEDMICIIAYIRTLPEKASAPPADKPDFPFSLLERTIPAKANFTKRPDPADSIANGRYLVNMSGCVECHTPAKRGQIIQELAFTGGRGFNLPGGLLRSVNITPDATGIGAWSQEQFIRTFKQYNDSSYKSSTHGQKDYNSIMPWTMYTHMTESDLASIYQFLRTLKPVSNTVVKWTPGAKARE